MTCGNNGAARRDVEDVSENIGKLVCASSEHSGMCLLLQGGDDPLVAASLNMCKSGFSQQSCSGEMPPADLSLNAHRQSYSTHSLNTFCAFLRLQATES